MRKKLRIGVIGVGHLGRSHVRVLSEMDSCELVGCYDIAAAKSESVAAEFGTRSFSSARDLISECGAISLVVPTSDHYTCAVDILDAGRHLFVEKPLAATVEQGREIVELADRCNLKVMVGHIERFNPAVISLRGQITYPSFIEAHRLASFNSRGTDVAVIFDLMIHDIDLCLYLTKSDVTDIHASAAIVVSDKMDIANARLTFASGCVANLTASRISPKSMRKLRIFQPGGYVSLDFNEPAAEIYRLFKRDETSDAISGFSMSIDYGDTGKKIVYTKPAIKSCDMLTAELGSFVESISKGRPVAIPGEEGFQALRIAAEIEKIAQAGLNNLQSHFK